MAQRPRSAPQALPLAPTVALPLLARLVALGLRGLTTREPPPGLKPRQRGVHRRHRLWGVHRLVAEHLCRAPSPPSNTRDSARIPPRPLVPCHLSLGLTRRVALPRG